MSGRNSDDIVHKDKYSSGRYAENILRPQQGERLMEFMVATQELRQWAEERAKYFRSRGEAFARSHTNMPEDGFAIIPGYKDSTDFQSFLEGVQEIWGELRSAKLETPGVCVEIVYNYVQQHADANSSGMWIVRMRKVQGISRSEAQALVREYLWSQHPHSSLLVPIPVVYTEPDPVVARPEEVNEWRRSSTSMVAK